jgi:putative ABC transport system permease protein
MTLIERSPEIGMLRTLGFSRGYIRALFVRETLMLAGISALVGSVIGALLIAGINDSGVRFTPPGQAQGTQLLLVPTVSASLVALLFIIGLAVVVAWFAARAIAARTIPVQLQGSLR